MKKKCILFSVILLILISFVVSLVLNPGHDEGEILISVNGYSLTLQDAIDEGFLRDWADPPTQDSVRGTTKNHTSDRILVYVGGSQMPMQEVIDRSLSFCGSSSFLFDKTINPGHLATEINVSIDDTTMSLQQAISSAIFCDYSWKTSLWSDCSEECGDGEKTRTVWCERSDGVEISLEEESIFCPWTKPDEIQNCNIGSETCGWSDWSETTTCSNECDGGTYKRTRTCSTGEPDSTNCIGDDFDWGGADCNTHSCAVDCAGSWNLNAGTCSVTCGGGNYDKQWTTTTEPVGTGAACPSPTFIDNGGNACNTQCCPVNGGWSDWSGWNTCTSDSSNVCGIGTQTRTRTCNNPTPSCGGAACIGSASDSQSCYPSGNSCSSYRTCLNGYCVGMSRCAGGWSGSTCTSPQGYVGTWRQLTSSRPANYNNDCGPWCKNMGYSGASASTAAFKTWPDTWPIVYCGAGSNGYCNYWMSFNMERLTLTCTCK